MPISRVTVSTPNYVLIAGNLRIGPKIVQSDAGRGCSAIYGFSDKGLYDTFCRNSEQPLRPYPLVMGYLRNELDAQADRLQLVVIDAAGPTESQVHAATFDAVLGAQESHAAQVTAAYRLTFAEEADAYRVEEEALGASRDTPDAQRSSLSSSS